MKRIKGFLVNLNNKLLVFFQVIGYCLKSFRSTTKGQLPKYEILQLSHRLEKGLLNANPKSFWGWEKASRLVSLIKINEDDFSNRTGKGVLKSYLDAKIQSCNESEREKAILFLKDYPEIEKEDTLGGTLFLNKNDVTIEEKEVIESFIKSRHSCRDYQNRIVSKDDIRAAISLALKCPSACNRQVTNCYVYQSKELQTIVLTANIRAYDFGEFNDWFVSPSIFAGYLSLTLHLYGIGSCIYRKQLYGRHPYNEEMRRICNIPEDEMIVVELRFGYYKDSFKVAVSNRHSVDDVVFFVDK